MPAAQLTTTSSSRTVSAPRPRRVAGVLVAISGLALVALHLWLLWRRIAEQQLFEPEVALRWLSGLALLGGFAWLRRQGVPLLRGRRALVLWLLVAVLHLGVSATGVEGEIAGLDPLTSSVRWLALPLAGGMLVLVLVALCAALLALRSVAGTALARLGPQTPAILPPRAAGLVVQLSSRPPPV